MEDTCKLPTIRDGCCQKSRERCMMLFGPCLHARSNSEHDDAELQQLHPSLKSGRDPARLSLGSYPSPLAEPSMALASYTARASSQSLVAWLLCRAFQVWWLMRPSLRLPWLACKPPSMMLRCAGRSVRGCHQLMCKSLF